MIKVEIFFLDQSKEKKKKSRLSFLPSLGIRLRPDRGGAKRGGGGGGRGARPARDDHFDRDLRACCADDLQQ